MKTNKIIIISIISVIGLIALAYGLYNFISIVVKNSYTYDGGASIKFDLFSLTNILLGGALIFTAIYYAKNNIEIKELVKILSFIFMCLLIVTVSMIIKALIDKKISKINCLTYIELGLSFILTVIGLIYYKLKK